jgi:hypothetical protein
MSVRHGKQNLNAQVSASNIPIMQTNNGHLRTFRMYKLILRQLEKKRTSKDISCLFE